MERKLLMQMMADPESRKVLTADEMMDGLTFVIEDIQGILNRREARNRPEIVQVNPETRINIEDSGAEGGT